ncbi:hypothetical protein M5D96_007118 [Drosophila gunungcola]|uniref:Secreted protein n=1 Tax=Drosophila gunungcola TaxID=103775 RepID=A0A9Q0BPD9_9MUSC|nr:hypothetical protein M5D96_007118 [Drosophila gunungcola]
MHCEHLAHCCHWCSLLILVAVGGCSRWQCQWHRTVPPAVRQPTLAQFMCVLLQHTRSHTVLHTKQHRKQLTPWHCIIRVQSTATRGTFATESESGPETHTPHIFMPHMVVPYLRGHKPQLNDCPAELHQNQQQQQQKASSGKISALVHFQAHYRNQRRSWTMLADNNYSLQKSVSQKKLC